MRKPKFGRTIYRPRAVVPMYADPHLGDVVNTWCKSQKINRDGYLYRQKKVRLSSPPEDLIGKKRGYWFYKEVDQQINPGERIVWRHHRPLKMEETFTVKTMGVGDIDIAEQEVAWLLVNEARKPELKKVLIKRIFEKEGLWFISAGWVEE